MIDRIKESSKRNYSSEYKYLMDFFLIAMDKNISSKKLFHRYIPAQIFYETMKNVVEEAFRSSSPLSLDFSRSIYDGNAIDTNIFAINKTASEIGLKPGEGYVYSDNGKIMTQRQIDQKKEEYYKGCRERFRSSLIENINSTKWTMLYDDNSNANDRYNAEEIEKMGNIYGKTALMDIVTFGMGELLKKPNRYVYKCGKRLEKTMPKTGKAVKKISGHYQVPIGFTKNPKISPLELAESKMMEKTFNTEGSIEVAFNNKWIRDINHKKNRAVTYPIRKLTNNYIADAFVEYLDNKDKIGLMGLDIITEGIPYVAPSKMVFSTILNGHLYIKYNGIPYLYDGITQKAKQNEELSNEEWAKILKPYLVQDVEKLTDEGMYYLCKYFNVGDCEWLREKK